ncbi:MAG TPA: pyruvate kinase [Candidatus Dormibacteraeota bacterium]|jgi:pyruvate kinase|nr:pyruvate kinase [Candidatus Dormibacteraeota bacterium]
MARQQSGRKTRIVATLGPASNREPMLSRVLGAGVDVARLNFSHGTQEEHGETIRLVRRASEKLGWPIAILQDLGGPKIRVGAIAGGAMPLKRGMTLVLDPNCEIGGGDCVGISLARLAALVKPRSRILMDDGRIELRVRTIEGERVVTRVTRGHELREHKGVNLPGIDLKVPSVTKKDLADLRFGLKQGVDVVAISFVRSALDVADVQARIRRAGGRQPVIAKLERPAALEHLEGILETANGVMVARGDMAVELSPEQVPVLQKRIIAHAMSHGKPVVTATQMLESMVSSPRPTRAEASDVANAILDGTDAVMLSEETAVGDYPVEAVRTMHRIALAIERSGTPGPPLPALQEVREVPRAIALGACRLADSLGVARLIVFTQTGASARFVSKSRPRTMILAATVRDEVSRQLQLLYGIRSMVIPVAGDTDQMVRMAEREALRRGQVKVGDRVVFVFGQPLSVPGGTNSIQIHTIGGS